MVNPGTSASQPIHVGDEWTMVDYRVSELMENGGMSGISLPPLPSFGVSEAGSQEDGSAGEEEGEELANTETVPGVNGWSRPDSHPVSSDSTTEHDQRDGGADESDGPQQSSGSSLSDDRERMATNGSSRRRAAGHGSSSRRRQSTRTRNGGRGGVIGAGVERDSSSSLSPATRRRPRPARTERSGRRVNERPPPLHTTSEASSSSGSSSSRCSSSTTTTTASSPAGVDLMDKSLAGLERDNCTGGEDHGGRSGNGLVPFSLEDVTTIGPSETLSASSSPSRWRAVESGISSFPDRRISAEPLSTPSQAPGNVAGGAGRVNAFVPAVDATLDFTAATREPAVAERERPGYTPFSTLMANGRTGGGSDGQASHEGSCQQSSGGGNGGGRERDGSRFSRKEESVVLANYYGRGTGRGRFYSTAESQLSNSNMSTTCSSSIAVSATGLLHGRTDSTYTGGVENPDGLSGLAVVQMSTAAGMGGTAAAGSTGTPAFPRGNTAKNAAARMEPGAWSFSSAAVAGGGTGMANNAFGRSWGGSGGGEWGLGSGLGARPGSMLDMSSRRMKVLEDRAVAAEEQGEFWQGRARVAEDNNNRLEKVVTEQATKIAELLQEIATVSDAQVVPTPEDTAPRPPVPEDAAEEEARAMDELRRWGADMGGEPTIEDESKSSSTSTIIPGRMSPAAAQSRHDGADDAKDGGAVTTGIGVVGLEDSRQSITSGGGDGAPGGGVEGSVVKGLSGDALGTAGVLEGIGEIAFTSFSVGKVAMFFPTPDGSFLAFNVGCPAHLLSKESQALIGRDEHFRPYYVLGRIIEIQDMVCCDDNRYNVTTGQTIKVVSVESISPELRAVGLLAEKTNV